MVQMQWGGSNVYPQSMFESQNKKNIWKIPFLKPLKNRSILHEHACVMNSMATTDKRDDWACVLNSKATTNKRADWTIMFGCVYFRRHENVIGINFAQKKKQKKNKKTNKQNKTSCQRATITHLWAIQIYRDFKDARGQLPPLWVVQSTTLNFERFQNIMYVLITCKFKKYLINSNREKVKEKISDTQEQLTL